MPRPFNPDTGRVTAELPTVTRQQIAELMTQMDTNVRGVLIEAIASLYETRIADALEQRDVYAELDDLCARVEALEKRGQEHAENTVLSVEWPDRRSGNRHIEGGGAGALPRHAH